MLLFHAPARTSLLVRAFVLVVVEWVVFHATPGPGTSGRGLTITVLVIAATIVWIVWSARLYFGGRSRGELYVLAIIGGLLIGATQDGAGAVFTFVAIITAGMRMEFPRAVTVAVAGLLALAVAVVIYDRSASTVLGYGLGFVVALLGGANGRQIRGRAEAAELLLAQTQRSREEQLRAARLEESARIAREIHDVLAHSLAGLTIQLEATRSLIEHGAGRDAVLERVSRAHTLAREGLEETRRAIGVLRGESLAVPAVLATLVADYRLTGPVSLRCSGDGDSLEGPVALAVVRVAQEALTNVHKHASGAEVGVELDVGDTVRLRVADHGGGPGDAALAASGGGYGLRGMRERARILGGSLEAGPVDGGWCVELTLPRSADAEGGSAEGGSAEGGSAGGEMAEGGVAGGPPRQAQPAGHGERR